MEGKEYDTDVKEVKQAIEENASAKRRQKNKCRKYSSAIEKTESAISGITRKIQSIPAEIINIVEVKEEQVSKQYEATVLSQQISDLRDENKSKRVDHKHINQVLSSFDIEAIKIRRGEIEDRRATLEGASQSTERQEYRLTQSKNKVKLLLEVPCGDEYSSCKFIKDAYKAQGNIVVVEQSLRELRDECETLYKNIEDLNPLMVEKKIQKYDEVLDMRENIFNTISQNELVIEKNESKVITLGLEIEKLQGTIVQYEENREAIENLEQLLGEKVEQKNNLKAQQTILEECDEEIVSLIKQGGSLEQRHENLISQKQEMETLRDNFAAYDLFMRCVHTNGISLDVIKKKLPVINEEISKILANVVDFEVFFESEGNKLDIFIKHPKYEARPIEMGSGAEKTISAMAIRLALLSVSSLPKGSIFILDEPATALDAENMEGFIRILDMIKSYYQTVLLISHVDHLKDIADMTIEIDKIGGFASVNQ